MSARRDLAVVVLGASGITGRRAVTYLRDRAPQLGLRWGIAGRDPARLSAQVADWADDARPEILRWDAGDADSIRALVERAQVVVNFAGPFARLAPPVIEACVAAGTHYLDVTGEVGFVARMNSAHHDRARERGIRIVQIAGYEALPFDLLTRLGIEQLAAEHDSGIESADLILSLTPPPGIPRPSDGASRGTLKSLSGWLRSDDARSLGDPAALVGGIADQDSVRKISPIELSVRHEPNAGLIGPMIPTPEINPPVIQRSLALAGLPPIRYRESVTLAPGAEHPLLWKTILRVFRAANGGLRRVSAAPAPARQAAGALYDRLVPHSGSGPRPGRIEQWQWTIDGVFRGPAGAETRARVEGRAHIGYLATSRMTAEAGLLLADPDAELPEGGGCLTPAAALGTAELSRFSAAGLRFKTAGSPVRPSKTPV